MKLLRERARQEAESNEALCSGMHTIWNSSLIAWRPW